MNEKPTEVKELEKKYAIKKGISAMQAVENELNHMLDDLQRYKRWFNEAQNLHTKAREHRVRHEHFQQGIFVSRPSDIGDSRFDKGRRRRRVKRPPEGCYECRISL